MFKTVRVACLHHVVVYWYACVVACVHACVGVHVCIGVFGCMCARVCAIGGAVVEVCGGIGRGVETASKVEKSCEHVA